MNARARKTRCLVGDFETTVYDGQEDTEVWASAVVEMFTEDVMIFHSIRDTFAYFFNLKSNLIVYFHNLKFDGSFWLSFLLKDLKLKPAFFSSTGSTSELRPIENTDMTDNTFKYSISSDGQWYTITIKIHGYYIEIRDSLKLLPFSVREIGKSFGTKHKKLDMEYSGYRYAGCDITPEEREYICNDVLVVKEALEIMFNEGHDKLTIGSCCLKEFKDGFFKQDWLTLFPNLVEIPLDPGIYGSANVDEYIRKSYKGGWCYLVPEKAGIHYQITRRHFTTGVTADVNSLYPSVMHSESGNRYPIGKPEFWTGEMPSNLLREPDNYYYFIRIKTRFKIKPNKLPCIQIKSSFLYKGTEWLTTSDIYNRKTGTHSRYYYDTNGELQDSFVTLTLTQTDFALIKEHYNLIDLQILDGCYFYSEIGLFDRYINKYKQIKLKSKGAQRTLAKLFLNNLYGKFATSTVSSFKYAYLKEDVVHYYTIVANEKEPVYIPIGSAITSYARDFTIRTAQKNYHGPNQRGFIYADTDSIHCDLLPSELIGVKVHPSNFLCWKLEATWDEAIFTRQKTYIEHVVEEDLVPVQQLTPPKVPYYNIKCAGMPQRCKDLLNYSLKQLDEEKMQKDYPSDWKKMNQTERDFVLTPRTLDDFKTGLKVPSKLIPKTIKGGVLLVETTYEMRDF